MTPPPQPNEEADTSIDAMWTTSYDQIDQIIPAEENWKTQTLPLARIKKIMKSEEAIWVEMQREELQKKPPESGEALPHSRFMIAGEAPVLLGKACELLIKELTVRSWHHTERNRRRTLQRQDVHAAVGESEVFDFLIDIVPRITSSTAPAPKGAFPPPSTSASAGTSTSDTASSTTLPQNSFASLPHAPNIPQISQPVTAAGTSTTQGGQQHGDSGNANNNTNLSTAEAYMAMQQQRIPPYPAPPIDANAPTHGTSSTPAVGHGATNAPAVPGPWVPGSGSSGV